MSSNISAKKNLWIVTECYYPEVVSTGQYLTQTAEGLTDDFAVKVICAQPNYLSRGTLAPWRETHNGVDIHRVWSTLLDKNVILYRLVNMITLGLSMLWRSLRNIQRGDRVLVVTAPPNLPFTTAFASLMKGASYTLLIHDYYPDQLVALGKLRANSLFVRAMHFANSLLFKHAARMIVVGRDMAELVAARTSGLEVPIVTIPNWADIDEVRPAPKDENAILRSFGVSDKLVLLSAGNIGRPTAIETVAECARLLQNDDRFQFLFVGWGAKGEWLKEFTEAHGLRNVTMLGQRPRSEQPEFLNACDIGLVSLAPGMNGTAMPSRTYNILAAGKPILALCDEGSELDLVVREDEVGWRIRPDDPELMAKKLVEIYENKGKLPEMGGRARKAAEEKYSLNTALERYREALR